MKILITNDDSIESLGLKELASALTRVGDIYVVAPKAPQSAGSHATTLHKPLRVEEFSLGVGEKLALRVSGTPSDCVVLALDVLVKDGIDIVVSGINKGPNLGDDVIYSGTVAGAMEGAINGRLSFAFSVNDFENPDFKFTANFASFFLNYIWDLGIRDNVCFNVNVPNLPKDQIKGCKFTRLARRLYVERVLIGKDPFDHDFFWIGGKLKDDFFEGTDSWAVKEGYVAITPLRIDITDYSFLEKMSKVNLELPKEL